MGMFLWEWVILRDLEKEIKKKEVNTKQIWDFCDLKQKEMIECSEELNKISPSVLSEFEQGRQIAYREVQFKINKKCSKSK